MGTLYVVGTPIGNLEDLSPRALRVLREVTLVAAEDTRKTSHLFTRFDIHTPLTSYFEHNKLTKLDAILARWQRSRHWSSPVCPRIALRSSAFCHARLPSDDARYKMSPTSGGR
jgi:16S rRNA C1402 (ribose-2'-O) methylase RsmI